MTTRFQAGRRPTSSHPAQSLAGSASEYPHPETSDSGAGSPIYLVDLEATCWGDRLDVSIPDMEIIEIGAVLVTLRGQILDAFSTFVRPVAEPMLSPFCKDLTGIQQEDVDSASCYPGAMALLDTWMADRKGIWASWGNFDHRLFSAMEQRCPTDSCFLTMDHVNLKRPWKQSTGMRRTALRAALAHHRMDFIGRPHRGIDDARNIARLLPYIDYNKFRAAIGRFAPVRRPDENPARGDISS